MLGLVYDRGTCCIARYKQDALRCSQSHTQSCMSSTHATVPVAQPDGSSRTAAAGRAGCCLAARAKPRALAGRGAASSPRWLACGGASPLSRRLRTRAPRRWPRAPCSAPAARAAPRRRACRGGRGARPVSPAAAKRKGSRYTALSSQTRSSGFVCRSVTQAAAASAGSRAARWRRAHRSSTDATRSCGEQPGAGAACGPAPPGPART